MGPRTTVIAGLAAGVATTLVLLLAAVLLLPQPSDIGEATPSPGTGTAPPASAATSPGGTPGSPAPSGSLEASIGTTHFHVGEPAPPIDLPQLGGGRITLAGLAGHPVWINFMQTTCPPCVDEFPIMSGFSARYASTGLVVVAIDIREDEGLVGAFVQEVRTSFPVGLDASGSTAQAWDAVALPVHFWVDASGVIRAGALGGIGPDIMATNLQTILPGVTVTP